MSRRPWLLTGGLILAALAYTHHNPDTGDGATYVAPVDGRVTSGFGPRWGEFHGGTDIAAPLGTPIRAITDGTVTVAGPASGFGLWLHLRHDHDQTVSVYGHMHTITTQPGDHVTAGQHIATIGTRGNSTGPHLHLEIWPNGQRAQRVDPAPWLARQGVHLASTPPTGRRTTT